jgi:hypothetical protein
VIPKHQTDLLVNNRKPPINATVTGKKTHAKMCFLSPIQKPMITKLIGKQVVILVFVIYNVLFSYSSLLVLVAGLPVC